jgi:hypothetical protein
MNRKRLAAAALALILICGFAWAQDGAEEDEGIGLTGGLEMGFGDIVDKSVFSLTPGIEYEKSFGDLDVFGELDYTVEFDDPQVQALYLEAELGYNFSFGEASVLSVILNNNNTFLLEPELPEGATHLGVIEPSLLFTQTFDFGDLYGQIGFPINYLTGVEDETSVDTYLTLGWASAFGLGLELTGTYNIDPDSDMSEWGMLISYEKEFFYGEVEFVTDKEFKSIGVNPEIDISLNAWTFIIRAEIGKDDGVDDASFVPFIGAKYSF